MSGQVKEASVQYQVGSHSCDRGDALESRVCPQGYKQTEVGVIPEDWDNASLDSICCVIDGDRGNNYPSSNDFSDDGYCIFLSATNVTKVGFKFNELSFISKEKDDSLRKGKLKKGDVVLTTRGSIGHFAYFDESVPFENMRINSGMVLLRKESDLVVTGYLYLFLRSFLIGKQIEKMSFGSAQPQLTVQGINGLQVCFPVSGKEQTAIANALSDVDALITSLEKLIAKKRAIKTAAMQQLLTGKKRLPPFDLTHTGYKQTELGEIPEDWELVQLGMVLDKIMGGGTPSRANSSYWNGNIPWVTVKDFATFNPIASQEYITKLGLENSSSNLIPEGVLITSTRMALGKAVIYNVPVTINQDLKALFPRKIADTKFLYYWFEDNVVQIDDLGSGSTVKGLSLLDLKALKFRLPSKHEQIAIANVLSDMDKEIDTLEQRLNKTQQLKQGMMQELLTGRTRLI